MSAVGVRGDLSFANELSIIGLVVFSLASIFEGRNVAAFFKESPLVKESDGEDVLDPPVSLLLNLEESRVISLRTAYEPV